MNLDVQCRITAVRAALEVGSPLSAAFRTQVASTEKTGQRDLVTEYDSQAEHAIIERIRHELPDSSFLGEEGGRVGTGAVEWIVDPIDGTDNFARGIPFWCVSIAATLGGRLLASAVFDPVADLLFSADESGAYLADQPIRVRAADTERQAVLVTAFPQARDFEHAGDASLEAVERLTTTFLSIRNLGSAALGLAYVAAGWADATFNFGVQAWDVAAGAHLVERAGGRYLAAGQPASCFTPDIHSGHYSAYGRHQPYPTLESACDLVAAAYASSTATHPVPFQHRK